MTTSLLDAACLTYPDQIYGRADDFLISRRTCEILAAVPGAQYPAQR